MSALRSELARIVEATAFVSPAAFVFAGRPSSGQFAPVAGVTLSPGMPPVVTELMTRLYESCYARRFGGSVPPVSPPQSPEDPEWVELLSRANRSRERWEEGWQIVANLPSGQALARRGATTRALWPGEFVRRDAPGAPLSPGAMVSVYFARESRAMQPGFYFVFGETPADVFDDFSLVRFYWNVTSEGGAALVESLSTALNRWYIPSGSRFSAIAERSDDRTRRFCTFRGVTRAPLSSCAVKSGSGSRLRSVMRLRCSRCGLRRGSGSRKTPELPKALACRAAAFLRKGSGPRTRGARRARKTGCGWWSSISPRTESTWAGRG